MVYKYYFRFSIDKKKAEKVQWMPGHDREANSRFTQDGSLNEREAYFLVNKWNSMSMRHAEIMNRLPTYFYYI